MRPTCESPPEEQAVLLWAEPANTRGRSRQRKACFPTLAPEAPEAAPASVPHYSKHTVLIDKDTFMAYLVINYDQASNMYGIISYIKHGWHSAKTSQHMISLPNEQFHAVGQALHAFIRIRLEEVNSSLENLKLSLHGPRIVTTSEGMVEVFQMQAAHAHDWNERWPCATEPRAQTIPFGTIVVNKNTKEALKVALFDSRHANYDN